MNSTKLVKDEISPIPMTRPEGHCKNGVMLLQSIKGPMLPRIKSLRKDAEKGEDCEKFRPKKKTLLETGS
jgi:hypothetical protein